MNVISEPLVVLKSAQSRAIAHSRAVMWVCLRKNWLTR